ncbi:APH domain-containing protein [Fusarium keratoplasticum]|uniref:APH domain-containing protein n=1 Tax=Fusarium keratoplasticum TaxID=1328300 RepID=A0ACC0R784_9HYPO|nr:APH domain-containing protein [Fusarium keratoplasticum]KAI8675422.1 APH domain-containing protein [Fusarium keratoplasticum]KAI8681866.1 APH domain-containing protein [Fusarium keratoplasticum]
MNSIHPPVRTSSPVPYSVIFSVPENEILEPLPTPEQIEGSTDIIKQRHASCTARVGRGYVVKFGSLVDPVEGENMTFVRQSAPGAPVPKVYAIYQRDVTPRTTITYIIMDDVSGHPLDSLWDSLNTPQKIDVCAQLRNAFISLRAAQGLGYFGSVDRSKPRDDIFWADVPIGREGGSVDTEAEFIQAVIDKYTIYCGNSEPRKVDYYRRVLPTVLEGTKESVFTHNDFRRKNILIRHDGNIVILGWASAGWYPSYWDYTKAMHLCDWQDDWHEYIGRILTEYPTQLPWMSTLRTGLWNSRIVR